MPVLDRMRSAWSAFVSNGQHNPEPQEVGVYTSTSSMSPSRVKFRGLNDRSIVTAIYNRISVDVSGIDLRHVELDDKGRYLRDKDSELNRCLKLQPNIDQGPRAFRQDIAMTLFNEGVAAIVPVKSTDNPELVDDFDILDMRIGEVVGWHPRHVRVSLYNEQKGLREEIILPKKMVAIVENPLYAVMNEPNSTLQRLIKKLYYLDVVDEQSSSGKLDLIIQLPYVIKSEARKQQAEARRQDIELQLKGSQYGIAYTDGTEKITQLNRPAENNLLKQVEYLTNMLYGQLGITEEIMNGTANEEAMLNYFNRTIEPIMDAVVEAMQRAFLSNAGKRKNERVQYHRDPFKLVPVKDLAEIADKFTRNEILSANEIRGFMGIPPSSDPKADKLINSNMPQQDEKVESTPPVADENKKPTGTSSSERNSQDES